MSTNPPKLHIELNDDTDLIAEFTLPHVEEERPPTVESQREHYDEQILAALVSP